MRQDGVFLLRLLTLASNALTTVDLTGALWKNYWKSRPPPSDVTLSAGVNESTVVLDSKRRQAGDDSKVMRIGSGGFTRPRLQSYPADTRLNAI